jgi:hypothetical protein
LTHLAQLEAEAIYIMREVAAESEKSFNPYVVIDTEMGSIKDSADLILKKVISEEYFKL